MSKETIQRCPWAGNDPLMISYHDEEWGVPTYDEQELFELLLLEGAQAGLSWQTILNKREGYRRAFHHFDPQKIARMDEQDVQRLRQNEEIVRNKLKIEGFIKNARAWLDLTVEESSCSEWLWDFVDGRPIHNNYRKLEEVPASTERSAAMSKALKKRGFTFVGPTICYAFMQAAGMVNDHLVECFRYEALDQPG